MSIRKLIPLLLVVIAAALLLQACGAAAPARRRRTNRGAAGGRADESPCRSANGSAGGVGEDGQAGLLDDGQVESVPCGRRDRRRRALQGTGLGLHDQRRQAGCGGAGGGDRELHCFGRQVHPGVAGRSGVPGAAGEEGARSGHHLDLDCAGRQGLRRVPVRAGTGVRPGDRAQCRAGG